MQLEDRSKGSINFQFFQLNVVNMSMDAILIWLEEWEGK
jgi:hypothetical protein